MNQAPFAAKVATSTTVHGVTLTDDYAWLRDPGYPQVETPAILDHLKAENALFETAMAPHQPWALP